MDWIAEVAKSTIGKVVAVVLALAGLLLLIALRETLYGVWARAEAGVSKLALEAMLGLAVIAIVLLGASLWIQRRHYRRQIQPQSEERYRLLLGIYWETEPPYHSHCPVCKTPLQVNPRGSDKLLRCPKCKASYIPTDDDGDQYAVSDVKDYLSGRDPNLFD